MSLKGLVQPVFSSWLTGDGLQGWLRRRAERRRVREGQPHRVTWYHRADDPYSHVLAQVLAGFCERYEVDLVCRTVSTPPLETNPLPVLLAGFGHRDCMELGPCFGLTMPGGVPTQEALAVANQRLLSAESAGVREYIGLAVSLGEELWRGKLPALPSGEVVSDWVQQLEDRRGTLEKQGHYSSGMLHYGGEWYWGIDRLPLLEERLEGLGVGAGRTLPEPQVSAFGSDVLPAGEPATLECYLSVRSPYSYIALEELAGLVEAHGLALKIKPILPMVTRGHAVPRAKRLYILLDAKREAARKGLPFGRIVDPLGRGVSHVLAVYFAAERESQGHGQAFLQAAMRGIWSEGVEVASLKGLQQITARVGLPWSMARTALADERWHEDVERHRVELFAMGLWGVPSWRLGTWSTWGQDRIWLLDAKLRATRNSSL